MQTDLHVQALSNDPSNANDATSAALASSDPAIALLALMITARGTEGDVARQEVEHQSRVIEEMRVRIQEALKQAQEAQDHSGFWGDVSSVLGGDIAAICGVLAAAALVVATGGAGAPAILALAAAGLSVGADVGERVGLDPKICAGLAVAGALIGVLGGNVNAPAGVWANVAKWGNVAQAAAGAGGGGTAVVSTELHAESLDAGAEAKRSEGLQNDAWMRLELALEILKGIARDLDNGTSKVSDIENAKSASHSAIIARVGAA